VLEQEELQQYTDHLLLAVDHCSCDNSVATFHVFYHHCLQSDFAISYASTLVITDFISRVFSFR